MKFLELFCGTKSVSRAFIERGFDVTTLDINPIFEPTIVADILDLPDNYFTGYDVIWASPPCNAFSVAVIGKNWNYDHSPKNDIAVRGLQILDKTVSIIKHANPKLFWIENPVGKMRRMPIMAEFIRKTVTYCQYGESRMKPTDIWTNSDWVPRPVCFKGAPCHTAAPRGSKTGTQGMKNAIIKGAIPQQLSEEIADYAQQFLISK